MCRVGGGGEDMVTSLDQGQITEDFVSHAERFGPNREGNEQPVERSGMIRYACKSVLAKLFSSPAKLISFQWEKNSRTQEKDHL